MPDPTDIADEMRYATINGFRMRYRIRGEGHPIVCVHGLMGSIEQEDILAGDRARLKERYMVIHHDSRGRGESECGSLDYCHYTWEGQALDLLGLIDHLEIEKAHFIGGSQGSAAVLALAIRHPERVSAIILINPPEIRKPDSQFIQGHMEWADFIEENGMDAVTDIILSLPPNDSLSVTHPQMIEGFDRIMRAQDPRVIAAATRGTVQFEPMNAEQLQNITCDTLVLSQKGDGLHPDDIARFLIDNIPKIEYFIAPTITYYNDDPHEAPKRIMNFLSRIDNIDW